MQRNQAVSCWPEREFRVMAFARQDLTRRDRLRQRFPERIDHHVADEVHSLRRDALPEKIVQRTALRRIQQVSDLIGQDPIHFFRHGAIETTQSRLDVSHRNTLLDGDEAARQRRVDVADDKDAAGVELIEHGLESLHDVGGLARVRTRANAEVDVRTWKLEVSEQAVVQRCIVMLPGVNQYGPRQVPSARRRRAAAAPSS